MAGHATLLALAVVVHRAEPAVEPPQGEVDRSTVIELWSLAPAPREEVPPAEPSAAPDKGAGLPVAPGFAREVLPPLPPPAGSPESAPGAAPPVAPGTAPAGEEYGVVPAVPMAGGGGVIGTPGWALPGVSAVGTSPAGAGGSAGPAGPMAPVVRAAPGKHVLRDTMRSRDAELGLGTPGATAVANAVADAVRGSSLPAETSAVIVARIGGDGVLVSLGVQQFSSGDVKTWNGVAKVALAAIGKRKLGLAGLGPAGAVVQVNVRAAVTLPSGSKSAVTGRIPSLTEGPPRDVMPAPSPDGDACAPERYSDLKPLCGVGAKIGTFDVADMAARPHRSVKASFSVRLLDGALALAAPAVAAPAASGSASAVAPAPAPAGADAGAP